MLIYENIVGNQDNPMQGIDFPDGVCYNTINLNETEMLQRKQAVKRCQDCAQNNKENGSLHGKSKP